MLLQSDSPPPLPAGHEVPWPITSAGFANTHAGPDMGAPLHQCEELLPAIMKGKVTLLWPWKILDMWRWTQSANAADYNFSSRE